MAISKDKTRRTRINVRLDARYHDLAKTEAKRRRVAVRAIIDASLADRYDPEHERREQTELLKEVRSLRRQMRDLEFGNRVILEAFMLVIPNLFARLPRPTPAGKAEGVKFRNALLSSVERVLGGQTPTGPLLDQLQKALLMPEAHDDALLPLDDAYEAEDVPGNEQGEEPGKTRVRVDFPDPR